MERAAQVKLCGEQLRQIVEREGRVVLAAQEASAVPTAWKAADCRVDGEATRIYAGCDGVMVPLVTDAEKEKRRAKVREKRRKCGRRRRPLPPRRKGADQSYKEFKVVFFYDEAARRQHVAVTAGNHRAAGRLMRREAGRLRLHAADRLLNYVSDRREMIRYPEFRARQWQIGSGPTESQCRLTVERLKHPGQRWDRRNAEAITALGSLERSGQWQTYWQTPTSART